MKTNHTQGQWVVDKYNNIQCNGKTIKIDGSISMVNFGNEEEKANTHLIAAAPDMLEALIEAQRCLKQRIKLDYIRSGSNEEVAERMAEIDIQDFLLFKAIKKATNQL